MKCLALSGPILCIGACSSPAGHPDAPACAPPALATPWLRPSIERTVTMLAAAPRATTTERDAARDFLAGELTALGLAPQRFDYPGGADLYATLPATTPDPGPAIVVGAHFDTVSGSPGANDNATGCAVVLAVAHYLTDATCRSAPVTAVFFDQEEVGLFGSRAYAESISPQATRAVVTIDQVGWDSDHDRGFELELPPPDLADAWRSAASTVGVPVAVTATTGTDHQSFRALGFAALGLTEQYTTGDTTPYRHTPDDTPATVDLDYTALAAQLAAQGTVEILTTNAM